MGNTFDSLAGNYRYSPPARLEALEAVQYRGIALVPGTVLEYELDVGKKDMLVVGYVFETQPDREQWSPVKVLMTFSLDGVSREHARYLTNPTQYREEMKLTFFTVIRRSFPFPMLGTAIDKGQVTFMDVPPDFYKELALWAVEMYRLTH